MFSFMKSWLKKGSSADEGDTEIKEESVLSADQINLAETGETALTEEPMKQGEEQKPEGTEGTAVETPLSLHPEWEQQLDTNQKYALMFMASELPPISRGNVSLAGIKIFPHDEGVEVTAFIRNGLPRPIRFDHMNLLLLFDDNKLFARQTFDLSAVGEIPANHARPWSFLFLREHFLITDVLLSNWKLAFELAQKKLVLPQQLELEESWIKALSEGQKQSLIQLAKRLPPLQPGEVNVQAVQLTRGDDESLRALLLFRNGSPKSLSFEKLPLVLLDAQGDKAAEGIFELQGLTVRTGTSKPWLFIFPQQSLCKDEPDLSRWKVIVPSKS
ncbi:accessory Sec system S-layer assembly protein [Brevibacillus humidisoli]|uniref:accessory Sec system S-layer assembly protein n=1 Tax=Brevibacillus humidisoli TaxID=2895522 RepID=UPI001E29BBD3|nr:accessory Sec system S-layer assembly protein [Brevibacillus humidisoli]UFJ40075.1 accessory Sec system S-layer assembly protein [Brevibacillus humidisoli]